MAGVEFRDVEKVFPDGTAAVRRLSLTVEDGEFLVLLGPSGCGKSTVLCLLAGLEDTSGGEIRIDGKVVDDLDPRRRNVAMVFQQYALYPHMTVRRNLEFPLRMRATRRSEIDRRVRDTARLLGLEELLERKPAQLSGGQAQRVAMGRAIVREPSVFLMDEPLSNLDAGMRVVLRAEIAALQARLGTTTLYVTHDQVEAMTLGHRVAILRDGELQQVGPPREIYDRPANTFVAGFVGSPGMNLFPRRFPMNVEPTGALEPASDRARVLGIRPEAFRWPETEPKLPVVSIHVRTVEALGHEQIVYFDAVGSNHAANGAPSSTADTAAARLSTDREVVPGQDLRLALDTAAVRWFEEDGKAVN